MLRLASLLVLCLLALPVTAQDIIEGQARLVWGDPAPDSPEPVQKALLVTRADGSAVQVSVDDALLERAGGVAQIDGHEVRLEVAAAPAESPSGASAPVALALEALPRATKSTRLVSGTSRWISLMCKFSDKANEPNDLAYFNGMYADAPGRLDHYWKEVSYDTVTVAGSGASGWHTLPKVHTAYVPTPGSGASANLNLIFNDCVAAADAAIDFSLYDGINLMLNDLLDCCAWGGGRFTTLDGVTKSWRVSWNPPWSFRNISVIAHEMGHGFGLPHSNNSDGDTNPYDSPWDVMSSASGYTVNDSTYGGRGKHTIAYHKDRLGWIPAGKNMLITTPGSYTVTIDAMTEATTANYRMAEVEVDSSLSFTVEVRAPEGEYDADLPGKAVLLNEVRTGRSEPAWILDLDDPPASYSDNDGSMWQPGELYCNADADLRIEVLSETANGYQVQIDYGLDSNCPPFSVDDVFATVVGFPLTLPAPGILANDRDQNLDDVLQAQQVSSPSNGTLNLNANGALTYVPDGGFEGDDPFLYRTTDGTETSDDANVTLKVLPEEYDFQSATGDPGVFYAIGSTSAIGVKFPVYMTTQLTRIGASLVGVSGTVFAAIIELDQATELPLEASLATPLTAIELLPQINVRQDITGPINIQLEAGLYGLVLASGQHGASGEALIGAHASGTNAQYLNGDPTVPYLINFNINNAIRFIVEGTHITVTFLFVDGFESGNTSAWTSTIP